MATELMTLVQVGKIRPTVAEQITLEAIPKALERLAEGHVRGKIVARVESWFGSAWDTMGKLASNCRAETHSRGEN
jgi:hypothetical protein